MPNKVALLEIARKATVQWVEELIRADRRITTASSNCTRMFPWFSIQYNARLFEVSESVHGGCPEN
jgi:hypothetical protein